MRILAMIALLAVLPWPVMAAETPDLSFDRLTAGVPAGWRLDGAGAVVAGRQGRAVLVRGTGDDESFWRADVSLAPHRVYLLSFLVRGRGEGGCAITGPSYANQDCGYAAAWQRRESAFLTPRGDQGYLRFGQWHAKGEIAFDQVSLRPAQPVHLRQAGLELGGGERVSGGAYTATCVPTAGWGNYCRSLADFTANWNTDRWRMDAGSMLLYRHQVGARQLSAELQVAVGYWAAGHCVVEASNNGRDFTEIARLGDKGGSVTLPAALFPADAIWVRLSASGAGSRGGDSDPGSFQVVGYEYRAKLEGTHPDLAGRTALLETVKETAGLQVTVQSLGSLRPAPDTVASLAITSDRRRPVEVSLAIGAAVARRHVTLAAGANTVVLPYRLRAAGTFPLRLSVRSGKSLLYEATAPAVTVPVLLAADYGRRLPGSLPLWWCDPAHKVSRDRPLPAEREACVRLACARNEYEPFQLVLRPERNLARVTVSATPLAGPAGHRLNPPELRLVEYVTITNPTDSAGTPGPWPDPLPPYAGPFAAPAGRNQPLWITAYVPAGAPAGLYRGAVTVSADGRSATVPLQLRVWGFTLPETASIRSGFGFGTDVVAKYENLTGESLNRALARWYDAFRTHRMAPYNPMGSPPVNFGRTWLGGSTVTEGAPEGARCLHLVDSDDHRPVDASSAELVAVTPGRPYRLAFSYRTGRPGGQVQLTLGQFDAGRRWLWGRNIDLSFDGDGAWQQVSLDVGPRLSPETAYVGITLRPCLWTEDGRNTGEAWFDAISLTGPDGANLVTDGGFERAAVAQVTIDWAAWDRAAHHYLDELGFNSFTMPIQGLGGGIPSAKQHAELAGARAGTPEYRELMRQYLAAVQRHLAEKGWLDKAYVYWYDEPAPEAYEYVRGGMRTLRELGPGLDRFLTVRPVKELYGEVQTWCVPVGVYDPKVCQQRQAQGEDIWWYLCCGPHSPYIGLFIDHPGTDFRQWLWMSWKYKVTGILIWETVWWRSSAAHLQNPWDDPMSYVGATTPDQRQFWGNGDGRLWYPSNRRPGVDTSPHPEGPVPSMRVELLREGIEDYEYFTLLRKLCDRPGAPAAAKALLEVPPEVVTDLTHYSLDPAPLMRHRAKLAAMIEKLGSL